MVWRWPFTNGQRFVSANRKKFLKWGGGGHRTYPWNIYTCSLYIPNLNRWIYMYTPIMKVKTNFACCLFSVFQMMFQILWSSISWTKSDLWSSLVDINMSWRSLRAARSSSHTTWSRRCWSMVTCSTSWGNAIRYNTDISLKLMINPWWQNCQNFNVSWFQ